MPGLKRTHSTMEDNEENMEVAAGQERDPDGGAGNTTSAGQGLIIAPVIRQKHYGWFYWPCKRNMRFSMVNSVQTTTWVPTTVATNVALATDFFHIPHNYMSFWINQRHAAAIQNASAYEVIEAEWRINNLQLINGQEQSGQSQLAQLSQSGNMAPTFDTLYNQAVTPQSLSNIWNYDIYGGNRAVINNTTAKIRTETELAESEVRALPLVQFNALTAATPSGTLPPSWFRWCLNHNMGSTISCKPIFCPGVRRICPAINGTPAVATAEYSLPGEDRPFNAPDIPDANAAINSFLGNDFALRKYSFRQGNSGAMMEKQYVNAPFFIRARDPPRMGLGATGGSDNSTSTTNANATAMKFNLDIETDIVLKIHYDTAAIGATNPHWNDGRWISPGNRQYDATTLSPPGVVVLSPSSPINRSENGMTENMQAILTEMEKPTEKIIKPNLKRVRLSD